MLKEQRRRAIQEIIGHEGRGLVRELAGRLHTSQVTIREDLDPIPSTAARRLGSLTSMKPETLNASTRGAAGAHLREVLSRNRAQSVGGICAVCSSHPAVIDAAIRQALESGLLLEIESTANQVNQFGGYTGQTPSEFAAVVTERAARLGLPRERLLLGGDHLGPYPWRREPATTAMGYGRHLVKDCVLAGYGKIHLDASAACAGDGGAGLAPEIIAQRNAALCQTAEDAWSQLPAGAPAPLYVVGTEVPAPGGETAAGHPPPPTSPGDVQATLEAHRAAFSARGVQAAWERVIGLVVQPGVEFGEDVVFDYDRRKSRLLSQALPPRPIVYEAHSTDYQLERALREMVVDHFAILKVGPWLTYAFREAVFALTGIEREWIGPKSGVRLSRVRETLEAAMLGDPQHWRPYHSGDEEALRFARVYSLSDRCRYYWHQPSVQNEIALLLGNLTERPAPLTLVSQYMSAQHAALRAGRLAYQPALLIDHHIRGVLRQYDAACSPRREGLRDE